MIARINASWELAKQALNVLRMDKELLLFPVASGLSCLAVLASFAVPLWHSQYLTVLSEEETLAKDPWAYLILFAFYLANYFVVVFFNAALVACAIIRFKGGDPTLRDGLRAAAARLPQIFGWALVSATMGLILKSIESSSEKSGQLVAGLLGMGWSAITYFVVPVLVVERVGPYKAIQRSLGMLRKTWGEALWANVGIGAIFLAMCVVAGIVVLPAIGLSMLGVWMESVVLLAVGCGIALVAGLLMMLVASTLHAILAAALYLYAAEGAVPSPFDANLFQQAFQPKS